MWEEEEELISEQQPEGDSMLSGGDRLPLCSHLPVCKGMRPRGTSVTWLLQSKIGSVHRLSTSVESRRLPGNVMFELEFKA